MTKYLVEIAVICVVTLVLATMIGSLALAPGLCALGGPLKDVIKENM